MTFNLNFDENSQAFNSLLDELGETFDTSSSESYILAKITEICLPDGTPLPNVNGTITIPLGSSTSVGLIKLYTVGGYNQDGAVSQKLFTDAHQSIGLALSQSDPECVVLKKLNIM